MFLNEYYYRDQTGKIIVMIHAKSITEADSIMQTKKLKHISTAIGGKLIIHDPDKVRTAVLTRNASGLVNQTITLNSNDMHDNSFQACSLNEALTKYKKQISIHRYNPNSIVIWKTALGNQIVKSFDPPDFSKQEQPTTFKSF